MIAVEMLARSTPIIDMIMRLLVTFTPNERAVLSSNANKLQAPATKKEAISPANTYQSSV